MKISGKLTATTLLLVAVLLASIASTFAVLSSMDASISTIVVDRLVPTRDLKAIGDLYAVNIVDTSHKVRSGALSWEDGAKSIDVSLEQSEALWKAYLQTYLTAEEMTLAGVADTVIRSGREPIQELITIVAAKDQKALEAFVSEKLYPAVDPISENISKLVELQIRVGNEEFAKADAEAKWNMELLVGFSILALLVSVLSLWVIFRGVSNPLKAITARMTDIAGGDYAVDIPFASKNDEIGAIAKALEVFRQAGLHNLALEKQAEQNRLRAERERIEVQRKAEEDAAERLRIATAGLAAGLQKLAAGDLTVALNQPFSADFEQLRHDFNASVQQLGTALVQVSNSVVTIEGGTREIADSANDFSKRTEQQAAALEQTAAALDEITTNVANSAKLSGDARSVANHANASAAQSAMVVSNAEDAMRRIEQSSQQISNIIGVIDEIAFQTNLLALNAGVEAARAGDAGKGFAVVAQEVRELAQRSAKAAKEIKALIQNSSTEVEGGVKLVRETGEALKTIGGYIVDMNAHVESIAASSSEQSSGLSEINTAVNQMDHVTQKNAAMAEESTAAAASLAQEAGKLRELVGQFHLDQRAVSQASSLRQTASAMARPSPVARASFAQGNLAHRTDSWQEF